MFDSGLWGVWKGMAFGDGCGGGLRVGGFAEGVVLFRIQLRGPKRGDL